MDNHGGHNMAEEKNSLKIKEINEALSDYKVECMEGVVLEGNLEIEMDLSSSAQLLLAQSLGREFAMLAGQLFDLSRAMGYPVDTTIMTK